MQRALFFCLVLGLMNLSCGGGSVAEPFDLSPNPDSPVSPDNPDVPDNPNSPDGPDNPDVSDNPDNPDGPDNPDVSDNPDSPDGPDNPDVPDNPDNPDSADNPDVPDNPDSPDNPDGPDNPDVSDNPGICDAAVTLPVIAATDAGTAQSGHELAKALDGLGYADGDPDSRWALESLPADVVFDLGVEQTLCVARFSFFKFDEGRVYQYGVDLSRDQADWQVAVPLSKSSSGEWTEDNLGGVSARYVRLHFESAIPQTTWAGLWEAQVVGLDSGVPDEPPPPEPATPARYLSEDFESADWASNYSMWPDGHIFRETGVAARSGTWGIRMHVTNGEHWGGAISFDHSKHGQGGNFKEIWARYYIRFGPSWRRADYRMGKAGYRARSDEVCGAPCLEMTDSNHLTEAETGAIDGQSYYHRNVSDQNLADGTFSHRGEYWTGGLRERERWYCVETHHILNTPGKGDGVYQNWLDGVLVSDVQGIAQRDSATFDIDNSVLITYVGGDWVADRDMDVYYDDWAVSDQRIGCE